MYYLCNTSCHPAIGKYFEAMAAFRDQIGKTEKEDETVYGEGDLVTSTCNAKGYGKDGSLLLETRYDFIPDNFEGRARTAR